MLKFSRSRRLRRRVAIAVPTLAGALALSGTTVLAMAPAPIVTMVSPTAGSECGGTVVTISGSNLSGATSVSFGTVDVTTGITSTGSSVTVTAPAEDPGTVDVQVTTPSGTSLATPADLYTFTDTAPTLTSLAPASGNSAGGTTVTVNGSCFVDTTNIKAVDFGSTAATIQNVTPTAITVVSPADSPIPAPGATSTANVTVVTNGTIPADSKTSNAETYTYVTPPTVSSVSPAQGSANGGDTVTITGTGIVSGTFPATTCNITKVTFGNSAQGTSPTNCTETANPGAPPTFTQSIQVTSPAQPDPNVSTVDVHLWDCADCESATTQPADQFTYEPPPTVTGISPRGGPPAGGTVVTVTGTGFATGTTCDGGLKVTFSGTMATVDTTSCNDAGGVDTVNVTSPAHGSGPTDVQVVTAGGTSATNPADVFTYTGTFVGSVTPDGGATAGGTAVVITGFGFTGTSCPSGVTFGSNAATSCTVKSDAEIDAVAPAESMIATNHTVDVTVTSPSGTSPASASDHYTYTGPPTVTSLDHTKGPSGTSIKVVITGTGFFGNSGSCDVDSMTIGGQPATFNPSTDCTDTQLTVMTPTIPEPDTTTVVVPVIVTTDGGSDSTPHQTFTYVASPTVISVSPATGPLAGGNTVIVGGTHFMSDTNGCDIKSVAFGGTAATAPGSCSDTDFAVTVPAGTSAGSVDIVVTTNDGGASPTGPADLFDYSGACNVPSGATVSGSGSGGTAYFQPAGSAWNARPGAARYVASGGGQTFVLGSEAVDGGWQVWHWNGSSYDLYPGGLVDIAVGPDGSPWGVNSSQEVFHWSGGAWQRLPGSAYDIAVGPGGHAFVIGTTAAAGGCNVWEWNGSGWNGLPGGATQIAVGTSDHPWVINNTNTIWAWNGSGWNSRPGAAQAIAATTGSVWVLGVDVHPGGWGIWYWTGTGWNSINGGATSIAVGGNKLPWVTNASLQIYQRS